MIEDDGMSNVTVSLKGDNAETFELELGKSYRFFFFRINANTYTESGFELMESQ